MNVDFKDKVVLITGAGCGLGRDLALEFACRGAKVAANDIAPINVDAVVAAITAQGGQARTYLADVAKKVAVQAMIHDVLDDFGRIDILINHARVEPAFPLLELDEWDWHRALDVNLTGAFLMTQSVGRVMREQGGGVILHIMSQPRPSNPVGWLAYTASTQGLIGLTRAAALELSDCRVRVNVFCSPLAQATAGVEQNSETDYDETLTAAILSICHKTNTLTGSVLGCLSEPQAGREARGPG